MNENKDYFIKEIKQRDLYHFMIRWNDGEESIYRLIDLQRNCPCKMCSEYRKEEGALRDVLARRIVSIGNYAIRIEFTEGCSRGIYSYALLRQLGRRKMKEHI